MSYTLSHIDEVKIVSLGIKGITDKVEFAKQFIDAVQMGHRLDYNRYLFDLTESHIKGEAISNFKYLFKEISEKIKIPHNTKIAILVDRTEYSYDFLETVGIHFDIKVEYFEKRKKAEYFLLHDENS